MWCGEQTCTTILRKPCLWKGPGNDVGGFTRSSATVSVVAIMCFLPSSSAALFSSMGKIFDKGLGSTSITSAVVDSAPAWDALGDSLRKVSTEEELVFRSELENGRADRACALATKRLFDLPEGKEPRVTFYRDTAAWCPCERHAQMTSLVRVLP